MRIAFVFICILVVCVVGLLFVIIIQRCVFIYENLRPLNVYFENKFYVRIFIAPIKFKCGELKFIPLIYRIFLLPTAFVGYKQFLPEDLLAVPLIIHRPGLFPKAHISVCRAKQSLLSIDLLSLFEILGFGWLGWLGLGI
jgi:hypothetical protein